MAGGGPLYHLVSEAEWAPSRGSAGRPYFPATYDQVSAPPPSAAPPRAQRLAAGRDAPPPSGVELGVRTPYIKPSGRGGRTLHFSP